jgi:hypothetical protein
MTQHTPGPWAVTDRDWAKGYRIQATVGSVKTGEDIAQITNVPDARLIAAAPEMAHELKIMVQRYEALCALTKSTGSIADTKVARALLAKVEGAR